MSDYPSYADQSTEGNFKVKLDNDGSGKAKVDDDLSDLKVAVDRDIFRVRGVFSHGQMGHFK